jgi:hypothetical protein
MDPKTFETPLPFFAQLLETQTAAAQIGPEQAQRAWCTGAQETRIGDLCYADTMKYPSDTEDGSSYPWPRPK